MSDPGSARSSDRPILVGIAERPESFVAPGGGSATVATPTPTRQAERLDGRVRGLLDAFAAGAVRLDDALPADDPELVVVFEVIDSQRQIATAAAALGIEILVEVEDEVSPDDDFPRVRQDRTPTGSTAPVGTCLHALCATRTAATELVALWNLWLSAGQLAQPYGGLADLFRHLRDVRAWSGSNWLTAPSPENGFPPNGNVGWVAESLFGISVPELNARPLAHLTTPTGHPGP